MYYINTLTQEYPLRTKNIRAENPNTSFSQIFTPPDHYKLVYTSTKPAYDEWAQTVVELPPLELDGVWTQQWQVVPRFTEYYDDFGIKCTVQQQAAAYRQQCANNLALEVRAQRDTLLSECDWTQIADVPVNKQAWATYRQSLRNVPLQANFPWAVIWPTKPE